MTRVNLAARLVRIVSLLSIASAPTLHAHELAQTQVAVDFSAGGRYRIDLCTDADAMLLKLQAAAAEAPLRGLSLEAQHQAIERLAPVFLSSLNVSFDRVRSTPRFVRVIDASDCKTVESASLAKQFPVSQTPTGPIAPRIVIQFEGDVPRAARSMTWSYSLMSGTYPLSVRTGSHERSAQWVEGIDASAPIDIASVTRPGGRLATAAGEIAVAVLGFGLLVVYRRRRPLHS